MHQSSHEQLRPHTPADTASEEARRPEQALQAASIATASARPEGARPQLRWFDSQPEPVGRHAGQVAKDATVTGPRKARSSAKTAASLAAHNVPGRQCFQSIRPSVWKRWRCSARSEETRGDAKRSFASIFSAQKARAASAIHTCFPTWKRRQGASADI